MLRRTEIVHILEMECDIGQNGQSLCADRLSKGIEGRMNVSSSAISNDITVADYECEVIFAEELEPLFSVKGRASVQECCEFLVLMILAVHAHMYCGFTTFLVSVEQDGLIADDDFLGDTVA